MSTLQATLDRMKAGNLAQIPEETKAIMVAAEEDIRNSGILSRLPEPGRTLPAFELENHDGTVMRSGDIFAQGPAIVTFYRGAW